MTAQKVPRKSPGISVDESNYRSRDEPGTSMSEFTLRLALLFVKSCKVEANAAADYAAFFVF
jgi:hypothetical protein